MMTSTISASSSSSPFSKFLQGNINEVWSSWNPPMPFVLPAASKKLYYADYQILAKIDDAFRSAIFDIDFGDEEEVLINGSILKVETHINSQMRAFCVYWLIYAAGKLNVAPSELHLGISCFDRYVAGSFVDPNDLHFVGLACLLTASTSRMGSRTDPFKYVNFLRNVYTLEEFINMKENIEEYLENKVRIPTTWSFVVNFVEATTGGESSSLKISLGSMALYLAELSLMSRIALRFRPSWVAASCIFLARYILFPLEWAWNDTLKNCTLYRASHLRESVLELHAFCCRIHVANLPFFRYKYSSVALEIFPDRIPLELFQDREFSLI